MKWPVTLQKNALCIYRRTITILIALLFACKVVGGGLVKIPCAPTKASTRAGTSGGDLVSRWRVWQQQSRQLPTQSRAASTTNGRSSTKSVFCIDQYAKNEWSNKCKVHGETLFSAYFHFRCLLKAPNLFPTRINTHKDAYVESKWNPRLPASTVQ